MATSARLNGMQRFMTGKPEFDPEFYDDLVKSLESVDPRLLESINAQWKGFKDYAALGGNPPEDVWEKCPDEVSIMEVILTSV